MTTEKNIRLRQRIDTNENWSNTGKLLKNEIGIDSTSRIVKYGTKDDQAWEDSTVLYNPGDAYIEWGGKNETSSLKPVSSAFVKELNVNRLNYYPTEYITIETSRDGGNTWEKMSSQ